MKAKPVALGELHVLPENERTLEDGAPSRGEAEADAIGAIKGSKDRFAKRGQLKAELARRLQHVSGHPPGAALIYSAVANGIKSSPIAHAGEEQALASWKAC